MTKQKSRKRKRRNRKKSSFLGAVIIEVLAIIVMVALFINLRNPPLKNLPPVDGAFASVAYPDTNLVVDSTVDSQTQSECRCVGCPSVGAPLIDQSPPTAVAQNQIEWRNPFGFGRH